MKYLGLIVIGFAFISCGGETGVQDTENRDTQKIPDSVPQSVMLGKADDWAYKPDSSVNDLVLGSPDWVKKWLADNGNEGIEDGKIRVMPYLNSSETQVLTISTYTISSGKQIPYAFRVTWIDSIQRENFKEVNYTLERSFITGHGIYMGEPFSYVQSVYKSQPMMKWIKGDTTYLAYAPSDKDQEHYHRYSHVNYSVLYKFVNDQLREWEMIVDPESYEDL